MLFSRRRKSEDYQDEELIVEPGSNVVTLRKLRRPEGEVPAKVEGLTDGYASIAKKLGFSPRELTRAEVIQFFHDNDIKIYPHDRVARYMNRIVELHDEADCWIWKPFRVHDRLPFDSENGYGYVISDGDGNNLYDSSDIELGTPYNKVVPERVLRNVDKISAKFGSRVKFFVTDYADRRPDPFIAVLVSPNGDWKDINADDEMIVFDVWDEPGFTG